MAQLGTVLDALEMACHFDGMSDEAWLHVEAGLKVLDPLARLPNVVRGQRVAALEAFYDEVERRELGPLTIRYIEWLGLSGSPSAIMAEVLIQESPLFRWTGVLYRNHLLAGLYHQMRHFLTCLEALSKKFETLAEDPYFDVWSGWTEKEVRPLLDQAGSANHNELEIWPSVLDRTFKTHAKLLVTRIGIALELFRSRQGEYAASLDQVLVGRTDLPPSDPMTGAAWQFWPMPGGGVKLYSLGIDGIDDGGVSASAQRRDITWTVYAAPPAMPLWRWQKEEE